MIVEDKRRGIPRSVAYRTTWLMSSISIIAGISNEFP